MCVTFVFQPPWWTDVCAPFRVLTNPWDRFGKTCFEGGQGTACDRQSAPPPHHLCLRPKWLLKAGHHSFQWGGGEEVYYQHQQIILVSRIGSFVLFIQLVVCRHKRCFSGLRKSPLLFCVCCNNKRVENIWVKNKSVNLREAKLVLNGCEFVHLRGGKWTRIIKSPSMPLFWPSVVLCPDSEPCVTVLIVAYTHVNVPKLVSIKQSWANDTMITIKLTMYLYLASHQFKYRDQERIAL